MAKTLIATAGLSAPLLTQARVASSERTDDGDPTWLVVYSPGPKWLEGKPLSQQPLRAHGAYMLTLYRAGALRWAGGYADDSGGAAAFNASDAEMAQKVVESDPAVTDGIFTFVLRRWNLVDWAALEQRSTKARAPLDETSSALP